MVSIRRFLTIRLLAALTALVLGASQVLAGDAAKREIIGFSPDGAYFAFTEYGIEDGTGFPYASLYVIDNERDEWVRGTPARAIIRNRTGSLQKVREIVRQKGDPFLWRLKIGQQGKTILSDPAERDIDAARFVPFTLPDEGDKLGFGTVRLRLNEFAVEAAHCNTSTDKVRGFVLVLEDKNGQPLRILHEDSSLPRSRGCVMHYGISDVIVFPRPGKGPVLIVMISVFRLGFAGLDRRFIGIASTFESNPSDTDP